MDALAERVTSPAAADRLREISEDNLPTLDLVDDHTPQDRAEMLALLNRMPEVAAATLPDTDGRDGVVALLRELADLVDR